MPNWVENDLTISGDMKELKKFGVVWNESMKNSDTPCGISNHFIPYPEQYKALDLKMKEWTKKNNKSSIYAPFNNGYNSGGYEWCIANWGTKWGICDAKMVVVEEEFYEGLEITETSFISA